MTITKTFAQEVKQGERFQFGKNWQSFLSVLNEERITEAEKSLQQMLEIEDLQEKSFLDIGSGSGLFSLAARRLGAKVHSFDYDPDSVACTKELRRRYFPDDSNWTIEQGSVLDIDYLKSLGQFDIVYSWGVLHHTGAMESALANASLSVSSGGKLFISIYNDQGKASDYWRKIKLTYNQLPSVFKVLLLGLAFARIWGPTLVRDLLRGKPWFTWKTYFLSRGMSPFVDLIDWIGGYPFEVAKPEEIFEFYRERGYTLSKLKTCAGGYGCNEFGFVKQ